MVLGHRFRTRQAPRPLRPSRLGDFAVAATSEACRFPSATPNHTAMASLSAPEHSPPLIPVHQASHRSSLLSCPPGTFTAREVSKGTHTHFSSTPHPATVLSGSLCSGMTPPSARLPKWKMCMHLDCCSSLMATGPDKASSETFLMSPLHPVPAVTLSQTLLQESPNRIFSPQFLLKCKDNHVIPLYKPLPGFPTHPTPKPKHLQPLAVLFIFFRLL